MTPEGATCADEAEYKALSMEIIQQSLTAPHPGKSGAYVFEKGEEALLARGWLADHATRTIDVQYFIWSTDNIGILAAESLLRAAERGIRVRVLVDDLLIDAPDETMLALNAHPNLHIKIYNPKHSVGTSAVKRIFNLAFQFRSFNQRMHDKTFTVDSNVSIIGGRNMADEYFDFDHAYNFRDRDILLLGPVVTEVQANFDAFWDSPLASPVEKLLGNNTQGITPQQCAETYAWLHAYAADPVNVEPKIRQALYDLHHRFGALEHAMVWGDIAFTHDIPGKNRSTTLSGGSETARTLVKAISEAKESITIQSPYLIMPKGGIDFFRELVKRGVSVTISTNSLAATDNLQAFSGYAKQRKNILAAGIKVFEFKPDPAIQKELIERYEALEKEAPTFAIHAKTMVIDHKKLFVGTFNLDPRSTNLNTEVGVLLENRDLATQVESSIDRDILPANSWNASTDNPDRNAPLGKRVKVFFWKLLPLEPVL